METLTREDLKSIIIGGLKALPWLAMCFAFGMWIMPIFLELLR